MDSRVKLFIERAENEIDLAKVIIKITEDVKLQAEVFQLDKTQTFYSAAISHCYYAIFYSAKAYLLNKGIETKAPEEHRKVFEEFKKFVDSGELDIELLRIYNSLIIKADELLGILKFERKKRGEFTYQRIAQANQEPAKESMKNALYFFKNINNILER